MPNVHLWLAESKVLSVKTAYLVWLAVQKSKGTHETDKCSKSSQWRRSNQDRLRLIILCWSLGCFTAGVRQVLLVWSQIYWRNCFGLDSWMLLMLTCGLASDNRRIWGNDPNEAASALAQQAQSLIYLDTLESLMWDLLAVFVSVFYGIYFHVLSTHSLSSSGDFYVVFFTQTSNCSLLHHR